MLDESSVNNLLDTFILLLLFQLQFVLAESSVNNLLDTFIL